MGKLFGILALIAFAGAALIGGGAWYWWNQYGTVFLDAGKAAMQEGAASGRRLDEGGCMKAAIERHKSEWSPSMAAAIRNDLWLAACLDSSRPQEMFCDTIPSYDDVLAVSVWAASTCINLGLSDSHCGNLVTKAAKYCSSAARTAKLRSGRDPASGTRS